MGAHAAEPAVLQDQDLICVAYRGNPLRDDNLSHVRKLFRQLAPNFGLGGRIHSAGGVIQNQDFGIF